MRRAAGLALPPGLPARPPSGTGLFGRRPGSTPDSVYSDAMPASGIVWDERMVAAYLRPL